MVCGDQFMFYSSKFCVKQLVGVIDCLAKHSCFDKVFYFPFVDLGPVQEGATPRRRPTGIVHEGSICTL